MRKDRPNRAGALHAVSPTAPARRFRLLPALALLLGALFPLAAAPASAGVLVSNLGQAGAAPVISHGWHWAQGFTTGGNPAGYRLAGIELSAADGVTDAAKLAHISVQLWSSTGTKKPGRKLHDLTTPSAFAAGAVSFAAPANVTLAPDTTYFVVAWGTRSNIPLRWGTATADDEDAGGLDGWSILNAAHKSHNGGSWRADIDGRSFKIRVNGPRPGANDGPPQKMPLSRFGRTVAGQVTDAVSERLAGSPGTGAPGAHATLAGQRVDLSQDEGRALTGVLTGLARTFGAREAPAADDDPSARHGLSGRWTAPASTAAARSRSSMTGRDLLRGSSFHLAGKAEGSGPVLAAWGRVAQGGFDGEDGPGRTRVDGEVLTGVLGADADFGRLLAGVAVFWSRGEETFERPGVDRSSIKSRMTTAIPYARLRLTERVSVWGLAGRGAGSATIVQDARAATDTRPARERTVAKTDIAMLLGALGVRGALLTQGPGGGMDLALKADAFFVRTGYDRTAETAATTVDASRLRLVLEGGRRFDLGDGASLRPSLELGVRHDGGDAETGSGLEIGGGVSYADAASGFSLEARARMLVAHADSDYREWGASATARFASGERGRGLSFSLSPVVGVSSSAAGRLWGAHDARALAPVPGSGSRAGSTFEAAPGLTAEAGYGMALFGDRFTGTPNVGFGMSDGGARDYRIGWRLTSAIRGEPGFEVNLDAMRREAANGNGNGPPEHGIMLRSLIRW